MSSWFSKWMQRATNLAVEPEAVGDIRSDKAPIVDRFATLLPYLYELERGLFAIDGLEHRLEGVGYVLEICPQTGATPEMAKHLESLFSAELPDGCGLQVTLFASPDVNDALTAFVASRTPPEVAPAPLYEQTRVLNDLASRRAAFLQKGTLASLHRASHFRVRDYRCWLAVVIPMAEVSEFALTKVRQWRERHIACLKTYGLYGYTWAADDLKLALSQILNAQKAFRAPLPRTEVDPLHPIAQQVVHADTHLRVTSEHLVWEDSLHEPVHGVGLSVQGYPSEYALLLVSDWLGSSRDSIPCPFLITTAVSIPDYEKTKSHANLMAARSKQIADSEIAHYLPSLKKRAHDYDIVMQAYADNSGLCQMTIQMFLFTDPALETESINAAVATLKAAHLEPVVDTRMHLQSFLLSLPMTMGPLMQRDLKAAFRTSTKTLANATHMVPILSEWRGTGAREREEGLTPLVMLTGRGGQITPFDLFAHDGNFNAIIVGTSGSGKSALTNDLITGNLATGGKTYVIDVGGSYRKLASLLSGQWIEFTDSVQLIINPFDLVGDIKEDMGFVLPILVQMASPSDGLSDYLKSVLQTHVIHLIERAQREGFTPTVTHLVESLRTGRPNPMEASEVDSRLIDLAVQLEPYAAGGTYGRYFDGASTIDFHSNFIVLELEGLKSRKDLQSVILLCLIFRITSDLQGHDLATRKIVVIDEAWDLLSHKYAAGFIENGYRRARKQNAAFVTITQSFADYYQNETAQAALQNADIRIALRQKNESLAFLEKQKQLAMSPWELRALKSLRLQPDEYAECLISTPQSVPAVLQIRFDPFSRLLYSTNASDVNAINGLMAHGLSLTEAIDSLVRKKEEGAMQ